MLKKKLFLFGVIVVMCTCACIVVGPIIMRFVEVPSSLEKYEDAVKTYEAAGFPQTRGAIALPRGLSSGTCDGQMYVTRESWGTAFLFCTWRGKGSNFRGYVYCRNLDNARDGRGAIELVAPMVPPQKPDEKVDMSIEKLEREGWFRASYSLD